MKVETILDRLQDLAEETGLSEEDVQWVVELLEHSEAEVRGSAVTLVADLLEPGELVGLVMPLLDDPSGEVAAAAAFAMGDVVAEIEMLQLLEGPADPLQPELTPEVSQQIVQRLLALVKSASADPEVRFSALCALGPLGYHPEVRSLIQEFLRSKDPRAREAAIHAAAASELAELWERDVISALGDDIEEVRTAAALAAGRLGLLTALPYLESMTMDKTGDEQFSATLSSFLLTPGDGWEELAAQLELRGVPLDLVDEVRETAEHLIEATEGWDDDDDDEEDEDWDGEEEEEWEGEEEEGDVEE